MHDYCFAKKKFQRHFTVQTIYKLVQKYNLDVQSFINKIFWVLQLIGNSSQYSIVV